SPTIGPATLTANDIQFTDIGANNPRDIYLSNNNAGLRFFGTTVLTGSPSGAAIQFWGNNSAFPGQLFLDTGATNSGALIFRTALSGGVITERMRVNVFGDVGIGTAYPASLLHLRKDVPGSLGPTLTLYNGGGGGGAANSIDFYTFSSPSTTSAAAQIMSIDD